MEMRRKALIEEIKRLANKLGKDYLSIKEFCAATGISSSQVLKHFDKWNEAVKEAGLRPLDNKGRPDKVRGLQREQLIEKMKETAKVIGADSLKLKDFTKQTGITGRPIYRLFPGGWIEALKTAGLNPDDSYNIKIPNEELFNDYFRVTDKLGRFPSYTEFARRSKSSKGTFENRFGNFTEFRKHAIQWGMDKGLIKTEIAQPMIDNLPIRNNSKEFSYITFDDRPILGERIDFRSLVHAGYFNAAEPPV